MATQNQIFFLAFIARIMIVSAQLNSTGINPENVKFDFAADLDTWEAPEEMKKEYPYYLSGFDYENRPVWVQELGKWDIIKALERGAKYEADFRKYVDQAAYRIIRSIGDSTTDEDTVRQGVLIYDMDGFNLNQLSSPSALAFHISTVRRILGLLEFVHIAYSINTSYIAKNLVSIMRPILGQDFEKLEVFGTNPRQWMPALLKQIPRDQLPPWYGGKEGFAPVQVYG